MKFVRSTCIVMSALSGIWSSAYACDLHGSGDFGRFSGFHPLAMQHYNVDPTSYQLLSLTHPKTTEIATGSQSVVNISYRIPLSYRNVKVTFIGSEGIEFADASSLALQNEKGVYELKYKAIKPGSHQIAIKVDAVTNNEPFSMEQKIAVSAS